jgi:hypothetical protein
MIGRLWRGATRRGDAEAYRRFLAYVLTREAGDEVEFLTLTFFESMDAVHAFAGPTPEQPVIEAEAARLLVQIGERVEHLDVAVDQRPG